MKDKGYEYPLFSLDLLEPGHDPPRQGQRQPAIIVAHGRLVVGPALLKRARAYTTSACLQAVRIGLGAHQEALPRFERHGLTATWAQSMGHWARRLADQEVLRGEHAAHSRDRNATLQPQVRRVRELWHAVVVSSQLAGLRGVLTQGVVAPKEVPGLSRALLDLLGRISAQEVRSLLADHGFDASLYAEVSALSQALAAAVVERAQFTEEQQQIAGALLVMRGALLGELSRLGKVATVALTKTEAVPLQMQRLLPPWQRNRKAPTQLGGARHA